MRPSFNSPGDLYHGFRLTKALPIDELQCHLVELVHERTGARLMHLSNDDPENLFCLSFQTRPYSSNGVAHILEHTVLCGSDKYPIKDPFFAMTRRSLNTFMNALTGADFTCYPASSQIPQDFYNLLDVYFDAVFHPRLLEMSFKQEGHRLEFQIAADETSPLETKGIVFNEMKGALSSAMSRLSEASGQALFPNVTYGYNSGGDPKDIPSLTYEQLREFHRQYYHPSRCLFFFYGNMPLQGHLDFLLERGLDTVEPMPPLPPIPLQPRFRMPVRILRAYPESSERESDENAYVSFTWLTCHILDQKTVLALSVLDSALMDTDASPLRHALLTSGLCKQANASLDGEMNEVPWMIVLKGCRAEDADRLEHCLRTTLTRLVREGLSPKLVESAVHQLELQRLEITGDSTPYGLSLFWRSGLLAQHGGNPEEGLLIHSLFARLRQAIAADPTYLTEILRQHILDNPHWVRVVMVPEKGLDVKENLEERARLDALAASLSGQEKDRLVHDAEALSHFQREQEEQDIDILPKLDLTDVPPQARDLSLNQESMGGLTVFHHACFTNQILYADLVLQLPGFEVEELPLVKLLTRILSEMGSGGRDYRATLEFMQEHTGGVDAVLNMNLQASDVGRCCPTVHLRGKALYRKSEQLFQLLGDMARSVDLTDVRRLKEVVRKHHTALESGLNSHAMRYAIALSASGLSAAGRLNSLWHGLEYFSRIRDLASTLDQRVDDLVAQLQSLQKRLLHLADAHLVITCDQPQFEAMKKAQFYGLTELRGKKSSVWDQTPLSPPPVISQGRLIASPVAFTAKVFPVVGYTHADAGALGLAAHLMENKTLHTRIREQGGAYGGGAVNNPMSAYFYFHAYRDPQIAGTLQAFDQAVDELLAGGFDEDDLVEAKLEMMQDLDAPVAPGSRGALAYGWLSSGKTLALRQRNRDHILSATCEDVIRAVSEQVVPNRHRGAVVVFGGRDLLQKENQLLQQQGRAPLKLEQV